MGSVPGLNILSITIAEPILLLRASFPSLLTGLGKGKLSLD